MPSCVVKRCKNNSTSQKKCQGITYHKFPTANQPWNNDWIKIIRNCRAEEHWIPSKTSVICSIHFDAHDLYTTKNGLRRVVTYAVPNRLLFELPNMEEQPVEPGNTISLQRAHQLSSHETSIFLPSPSPSLTQRSAIVADDFKQPPSPKTSTSLSLGLSSSELPLILETVATDSQKPLPSEPSVSLRLGLSLSQLPSIGGPSSPSTASNFKEALVPDTLRKRILKEKLKKKQAFIAKNKKRIKILNQKVRRLQHRNKSLKDILKRIKKQNYVNIDHRLKQNTAAADLFKNYIQKKTKKRIKYSVATKKFCLTLNLHSPTAYDYIRQTFDTCLPHRKTLAKWYGHVKGDPGFTEEVFQALEAKSQVSPN